MFMNFNAPEDALAAFTQMQVTDKAYLNSLAWQKSWQHLQKRLREGGLRDMQFEGFLGPEHLLKMMGWIDKIPYPDYFDAPSHSELISHARKVDQTVFESVGLSPGDINLDAVALYNVQDFLFQRAYPVLPSQRPRTFLDFGAGHGRQSALAFAPGSEIDCFIAMDATPACYLTQCLYYGGAGYVLNDYLQAHTDGTGSDFSLRTGKNLINHLPSWRSDIIEDQSVDMICCVQVLRELSKGMLRYALEFFSRALKPGGALYIRDHIGFHNVNQTDLDALLRSYGFVLEWQPHITDKVDVHGLPRIWRKSDPAILMGGIG